MKSNGEDTLQRIEDELELDKPAFTVSPLERIATAFEAIAEAFAQAERTGFNVNTRKNKDIDQF